MQQVKVEKYELIERLEDNRAHHREIFERAVEGYKRAAIDQLHDWLNGVEKGQLPIMISQLPVPEEHTDDYDTALEMLKMSVDQEVVISQSDFRCYVLDKWEWKRRFVGTNSAYTVIE